MCHLWHGSGRPLQSSKAHTQTYLASRTAKVQPLYRRKPDTVEVLVLSTLGAATYGREGGPSQAHNLAPVVRLHPLLPVDHGTYVCHSWHMPRPYPESIEYLRSTIFSAAQSALIILRQEMAKLTLATNPNVAISTFDLNPVADSIARNACQEILNLRALGEEVVRQEQSRTARVPPTGPHEIYSTKAVKVYEGPSHYRLCAVEGCDGVALPMIRNSDGYAVCELHRPKRRPCPFGNIPPCSNPGCKTCNG